MISRERNIYYAGYGANRDPGMLEAIIGARPWLVGRVALLNVELCVQRIDQTPGIVAPGAPSNVPVRELLEQEESWGKGGDFETYAIRPQGSSLVDGTLFGLTAEERELVAEWEMIDYGWYDAMQVMVRAESGLEFEAQTEGFMRGQPVDRVVDGNSYPTYLNDLAKMRAVANLTREQFLARQNQK